VVGIDLVSCLVLLSCRFEFFDCDNDGFSSSKIEAK
jgi:hypothetical protein